MENEIIDLPLNGFPTLRELFDEFDVLLFNSQLKHWTIRWSGRMKTSAGLCEPRKASIRISSVIHQYRSLKELRETILHEMIHAHLYQQGTRNETPHGPSFQKMAKFLGEVTQLTITTYHHFFDEVQEARRSYVWRCDLCGFEKHGRTKPSGKKHNGNCTGSLTRMVKGSPPASGGLLWQTSAQIGQTCRPPFAGAGTVLGGRPPSIPPGSPSSKERSKLDWLRSFDDLDRCVQYSSQELKSPDGGHNSRFPNFTKTHRLADERDCHWLTPRSSGLLGKEITLEQSMLTKGLILSQEPNINQWDD